MLNSEISFNYNIAFPDLHLKVQPSFLGFILFFYNTPWFQTYMCCDFYILSPFLSFKFYGGRNCEQHSLLCIKHLGNCAGNIEWIHKLDIHWINELTLCYWNQYHTLIKCKTYNLCQLRSSTTGHPMVSSSPAPPILVEWSLGIWPMAQAHPGTASTSAPMGVSSEPY